MKSRANKRSLRQKMQDLMSTVNGQIVINYAYNWGASVVILGALFKLIHLPGANVMLCIGMGTEVFIFFISAFDLSGVKRDGNNGAASQNVAPGVAQGAQAIVIGGGASVETGSESSPAYRSACVPAGDYQAAPQTIVVGGGGATGAPAAPVTPEMEQATADYLEQLKAMTAMLERCTAQAQNMATDSEQMNVLGKNLAGINAIYEMQLRSASTQIGAIDQVHEQTRRMAAQLEELNGVYARMIQAMTNK